MSKMIKTEKIKGKGPTTGQIIARDFKLNKSLYLMMSLVMAYFIIFKYVPMYGALIAFKDYTPKQGVWGSEWVGFKHFVSFLTAPSFKTLLINTIRISAASIVFSFPMPILLALLMNEISNQPYKKIVQNITYLPHFISLVIVCGMVKEFTMAEGVIGDLVGMFGGEPVNLLDYPKYFVPVYVISGIWQEVGWGTIIYLSALSSIYSALYEAATIDGAGRFQQTLNVTIPGIAPTIVTMFVLRMGSVLGVGFEKIILLYNNATMPVAEVISSYVYKRGLINLDWSFSSAVGLFNSVINLVFLITANWLNRKINDASLW